jgi:hypothetical protein
VRLSEPLASYGRCEEGMVADEEMLANQVHGVVDALILVSTMSNTYSLPHHVDHGHAGWHGARSGRPLWQNRQPLPQP